MYVGGTCITAVNALPLPWRIRLSWARFLYFLSVRVTGRFPSLWRFVESQNVAYKMGKGELSYQPILQLQKVLECCSECGVPPEAVSEVVALSELEQIPDYRLPSYIANKIFNEERASELLKISGRDSQTW